MCLFLVLATDCRDVFGVLADCCTEADESCCTSVSTRVSFFAKKIIRYEAYGTKVSMCSFRVQATDCADMLYLLIAARIAAQKLTIVARLDYPPERVMLRQLYHLCFAPS